MKTLVTGGAGFLGSHLVDALRERGDDVVVLDNLRRGRLDHLQPHLDADAITFIEGDIRDPAIVETAMDGAEVVHHLAAQSNVMGAVTDVEYSFTSNVLGTFNVLKAALACGVRRVVLASSREVYGDPEALPVPEDARLAPKNPYGASKMAAEAYFRTWPLATGIECQILRFANLYGSRDRDRVIPLWLDRALNGRDLQLYGGKQILDFLWIGHAVQALLASADCPVNGPVNVGSGQGVSLQDLAAKILELTGSKSQLRLEPARDVEVVRFVANVNKMRDILGVEPPDDPLAGLADMIPAGTQSTQ